jgi:hypothetical protein
MTLVSSGLREIDIDDGVECPRCGHSNSLIECLVRGWEHEQEAGETDLQFLARFFNWEGYRATIGEIECVCGEILPWSSPEGAMDVGLHVS